jgi:hypothetical protein
MNIRPERDYIKYVYWLTETEEGHLRQEMAERNIRIKSPKGVPCMPLDRISRIAILAPEVWNGTCARQGSWYRASAMNGLFLVISSFKLRDYEGKMAGTIKPSSFAPPRLATEKDKRLMVRDREFMAQIPADWERITERDKKVYLLWAKKMGSEENDFNFLYLSHTANHANFIKPRFFISEGKDRVPYSLDRTAHLCSSCLELFQIIGSQYGKKLVAPCPGATLFARLRPDQYLLVEKPLSQ